MNYTIERAYEENTYFIILSLYVKEFIQEVQRDPYDNLEVLMTTLNPSEFSYTVEKKIYTIDGCPTLLLRLNPKATIPKGTVLKLNFIVSPEMLENKNFLFPITAKEFGLQQFVYYKLSDDEISMIETIGSQAQNSQVIGGIAYLVIYFMQMFGTMLSYSMLGASQMTETYRYINISHPPNLQKVYQAKVVPDLIKTLGFGPSEANSSNSSNSSRLLFSRSLASMNLPPNFLFYHVVAATYPNYFSHFIKLIVGIVAGYFLLWLKKRKEEWFNYESGLRGKIALILYNMFIWNFFYVNLISDAIPILLSIFLSLKYSNYSDSEGLGNFFFAPILYFLHLRGIIAVLTIGAKLRRRKYSNGQERA